MSIRYEATGTIHAISAIETRKTFTFRKFVLLVPDGKFPQTLEFQSTRDAMMQLDGLGVGDEVTVKFNLKGREWTSPSGEVKCFVSLDAWQIEATKKVAKTSGAEPDPFEKTPLDDQEIPF